MQFIRPIVSTFFESYKFEDFIREREHALGEAAFLNHLSEFFGRETSLFGTASKLREELKKCEYSSIQGFAANQDRLMLDSYVSSCNVQMQNLFNTIFPKIEATHNWLKGFAQTTKGLFLKLDQVDFPEEPAKSICEYYKARVNYFFWAQVHPILKIFAIEDLTKAEKRKLCLPYSEHLGAQFRPLDDFHREVCLSWIWLKHQDEVSEMEDYWFKWNSEDDEVKLNCEEQFKYFLQRFESRWDLSNQSCNLRYLMIRNGFLVDLLVDYFEFSEVWINLKGRGY